jgi:arylsulfatase A-like enzyme
MRTRMTLIAAALLAAVMLLGWLAHSGLAQEKPKAETAPPADTPSVLPRPDFHFPGNVGRTHLHVIDIVPTLYEVIGITPPVELNGVP